MTQNNNYKRWDESENKQLTEVFKKKTNKELAKLFNRTPDSIRKQLAKLDLKRPKKVKEVKIPKKRGRKKKPVTIHMALMNGLKIRKKLERESRKEAELDKKKQKEKDWAEKELKVINLNAPDLTDCFKRKIYISGQETIIFAKTKKNLNKVIATLLKNDENITGRIGENDTFRFDTD